MASANKSKPTSQVRIIGGQFKRRQISFVDTEGLRPTPDRLRETLFNWLMADMLEARVLDMCAGSGVLGLEALSRGASFVSLVEPNIAQYQQLNKSIDTLGVGSKTTLINSTAQNALVNFNKDNPFDIIFIDPPYALNLWQELLHGLITYQLYHRHSLIYLESNQPLNELLTSVGAITLKTAKVGQVYATLINLPVDNL